MGVLKNVSNGGGFITMEGHDCYFTNNSSVENLICNITMTKRMNEQLEKLITYGGLGIETYLGVPMMVRDICNVCGHFGKALEDRDSMYHEVFCLEDEEMRLLHYNILLLWGIGMELCDVYFKRGFQVVFALHEEWGHKFHYHFAVSMVNANNGSIWKNDLATLKVREQKFNDVLGKHIAVMGNATVPITFDSLGDH